MSDLICRKTMMRCQTPGMCAPHGGCFTGVLRQADVRYAGSAKQCQQPQAHPDRCGCVPQGTEQVSSAWLAQLREEYRLFGDENKRLTAENAAMAQRCREREEEARAPLCFCGLPMAKNPHPDAGKPDQLLEVGAVYVCIPCLNKANRGHAKSANTLRAEVEALRKDAERYRGVRRVANAQGYTNERFDAQTDERIARFDAALEACQ